jgi:hypothetical protein
LVNEAELIAGYLECATRLRLAFTERQLNIEGESLELPTVPSGQIEVQTIEARDDFRWAGNQQLWWRDGKPQDELLLKIDVPQAGDYELLVNLTKAPDYGIVSIWLDDHQDQAKTIDAYAPQLAVSQEISLGQFALTAGQHLLHIKIEGTHKQSIARHMFGLDYLVLKSGQTDADRANYQQQSKDFCREFGLDAAELERWVIALRDEAMLADSHPLSAFQQLANAPQDSGLGD